jgi:hypothetical protein
MAVLVLAVVAWWLLGWRISLSFSIGALLVLGEALWQQRKLRRAIAGLLAMAVTNITEKGGF